MYEFSYKRAQSLEEACSLLSDDTFASPLSGGQTLMPVLRARLAMPTQLVDLGHIDTLKGISSEGGRIRIGAMETHCDVSTNDIVCRYVPALAKLAGGIGDPQVRHRGTIGGSIANNDPAACYPSATLALGADIHTSNRTIAADDFFTGMFSTALEPGEIITAVSFPHCDTAHYEKHSNPASRFALIGVFAAQLQGGIRIAVTGAGTGVFRWREGEAVSTILELATANLDEGHYTSDLHGSAAYRMQLTRVTARKCLEKINF